MNTIKRTLSSEKLHRPLLMVASIALVLLLLSLAFASPTIGWFKNHSKIRNDAVFSNFVTNVSCTVNGKTTTLTNSTPCVFAVPANKTAVPIITQITYQGESAAYLRVSICGGYYNKNTKTYLPIDANTPFVTVSGSKWVDGKDGYWYYPTMLEHHHNAMMLETLTLTTNAAVYSNMSDKQAYECEVYVNVDAVQANRFKQVWDIDEIPTV